MSQSTPSQPISNQSPDGAVAAPTLIASGVLWLVRLLAIAGAALAAFLTFVHYASKVQAERMSLPFCSPLSWFDCDVVLSSEWGTVFSIPVSLPGLMAYAVFLGAAFHPRARIAAPTSGPWLVMTLVSAVMAGAAAWFIYLQVSVLQKVCPYCMAEHTLGLCLFAIVWVQALGTCRLPTGQLGGSLLAGVAATIALAAGQHLDSHSVSPMQLQLVGQLSESGYDELDADSSDRSLLLAGGKIRLDMGKHLVLGDPRAKYKVLEVVDYGCPHCMRVNLLLKDVQQMLGPDTSFLILPIALAVECNKYYAKEYETTGKHFVNSCELAMLAHAVWLNRPSDFSAFHYWLFEHQDAIRSEVQMARDEAARIVGGADRLRELLETGKPAELLQRDIEINALFGGGQLPTIIANDFNLGAIATSSDGIAKQIYDLFHNPPAPEPAAPPNQPDIPPLLQAP